MEENIKRLMDNWKKRNIAGFYCADKQEATQKLSETTTKLDDANKKITEMQAEIDTLKLHIPKNFQAKPPQPEKQEYPKTTPYSY